MSKEFNIITKQNIDTNLIPDNVNLTKFDGYVELEMFDITNFGYVLYLFLMNSSIEEAHQMFLSGSDTDDLLSVEEHIAFNSDISSFFNLIDKLELTDFLVATISDFADMPDNDEFSIPIVRGNIVKSAICCYLKNYQADYLAGYKLLDIPVQ